jgi:hypothetical protein
MNTKLQGRQDKALDAIKMLDYIIANNDIKNVKEGKMQELFNTIYDELKKIERIKILIDEHAVYSKGEFKWWKPIDTSNLIEILFDLGDNNENTPL